MASAAILSVTIIPVLMVYFITPRAAQEMGMERKPADHAGDRDVLAGGAAGPACGQSCPASQPYRWWIGLGWACLAGMLLVPQKIIHEEKNPISRMLQAATARSSAPRSASAGRC
jgi:Cu(I)/Ag(I) efflux system membrane protein CusA/SilA